MNPVDFADDFEMTALPASFLAHLQPAGAFLQQQEPQTQGLQSPTALAQRQAAPEIAPLAFDARHAMPVVKPASKSATNGPVAMSFMSAMRRGLEGMQDSDSEDDEDEEDDDDDEECGGYYQPAYNQYHAPTTSYTGRASAAPTPFLTQSVPAADDDELIFPMEL